MFTLLTPSALLALLGLLVPVAIHLWNRRPGREVAVGSLRWLEAGANRRLRNLKPEQLWLLLLRAALLAVLALALAGPVWRQLLPASRGQVLVSPELLGTPAFAAVRPTVDSLRRRGYALRWLAAEFPKISRAALRADSLGQGDSARLLVSANPSSAHLLWARVQQAASTFPHQPLYVLTPSALRNFQGPQTPLPARVTWQALPTGASNSWVQAAALRGDSLRLLIGHSRETQTSFQITAVRQPQPGGLLRLAGLPNLRLISEAGALRLEPVAPTLPGVSQKLLAIPVRATPLRIAIYATPEYALDARYLQAGLRAAAAGLLMPMALSTTTAPPAPATAPDWLFWLADTPLPAGWQQAMRAGTQVWQEAPAPGVADKARLEVAAADEIPAVILRRSTASSAAAGVPLWSDGLGRPVLSRRRLGEGAILQLATRLNPGWSELADSPALPARLLALLQPETDDYAGAPESALVGSLASHDQRELDPTQLQLSRKGAAVVSVYKVETAGSPRPSSLQSEARPWLVLVAALLFALERLLARRRESLAQPIAL